jgi:cyanophycinase
MSAAWGPMFRFVRVVFFLSVLVSFVHAAEPSFKYFRLGNDADVSTKTTPGFALMGGGKDLDEAFKWMCERSGGGDFVVVRATGDDDYNPYINKLCKLNSVTTLVIPNKEAAQDPKVAETIRQAEALFISGGDQSNYIKYWQGTPVQAEINALTSKGVPVGGTSAGLAVMGQFIFSAMNDSAYSKETLADPYNDRVTIASNFLKIPHLENLITDTHFAKRDRQGRLIGFMARILKDGMSSDVRAIGMDEKSAGLMEPDGTIKIVGTGKGAYFYHPSGRPGVCEAGKPLTFENISVQKVSAGQTFDVAKWNGQGTRYTLSVTSGVLTTTASGGMPY